MKRYFAYWRYVRRHRKEVRRACFAVNLLWRGIKHDLSKYSRMEFGPYARQFFHPDGSKRNVRDATGAYDPNTQSEAFKTAWHHHWTHNDHHWEFWAHEFYGAMVPRQMLEPIHKWEARECEPKEMPREAVLEMMCDWWGAGRAQDSKVFPVEWFVKNSSSMRLHPETDKLIRRNLDRFERYMRIVQGLAKPSSEDKREFWVELGPGDDTWDWCWHDEKEPEGTDEYA